MRLHRLCVKNFAGILAADIELGPGLNVLYGPNDLGKSTLVEAIRLALLLPHTSTHYERYVAWTGAGNPIVEMTFETEAQRIWRVRKEFGKSGSSLLHESKNGVDFDEVERGRKVDAKIRDLLRWGIPEPGGAGKGLPESFLATALLSTQADVGDVLKCNLQDDPAGSGKERIAAALQAATGDPLFIALLRDAQARRDEAYTDKGAKKTAKGSVLKEAAERVNEARNQREKLLRTVAESEGTETLLRDLTVKRARKQEELAGVAERVVTLERLALQAANRAAAAEQVRLAEEDVRRIRKIGADVDATERMVTELVLKKADAEQTLVDAQSRHGEADEELAKAEEAARAEGSDSSLSDTVARQQLELRKSAADQAVNGAQQRIDAALAARKLVEAAAAAERDLREQQAKADSARESESAAAAKEKAAGDELLRCDVFEETALKARLDAVSAERTALAGQRAALTVPIHGALIPMRRLANELASARGALDVGFVVTVSPNGRLDLRIRKDGAAADSKSIARSVKIEANAEVEIGIADVATVRVRGGRREAQERAQALEDRWGVEVAPHLLAAGVTDLDALEAKIAEARELDAGIKAKDVELESLRARIDSLSGVAAHLPIPGDVRPDLAELGADPEAGLRKRRLELSKEVEAARTIANAAANAYTLAGERARNCQSVLEAAVIARDTAIAVFPERALATAQTALEAGIAEKEKVAAELASLESTIAAKRKRIDAALSGARTNADKTRTAVETAQRDLTAAIAGHASQEGRLIELRKLRDTENLAAAETGLREAVERHAALPVPDRVVAADEVAAAQKAAAGVRAELETMEREIQRAHGALEQVGGAVARDRLRDATEAFELAERNERDTEAEYEAWRLLLEQMKEADRDQASNLGQALAPVIAGRFLELTQRRYESVRLTAQLGTEGVMAAGAVRLTSQISVGTREQLSTLYRLALAEYLRTAVVLDDQLVQSDEYRMDWFRALLSEKARKFQIVVFTCRPGDYLGAGDSDGGFVRAVDLGKAVRR